MGLFSRIAGRVPRSLAILTMGFAGIFGIRTPPDPEVVAQTAPRPDAADTGPPPSHRLQIPPRRREEAQPRDDSRA